MRFLIDEDVDVRLIGLLRRLGHEAKRVPSGAKNGAVIRHIDIHPPRLAPIAASLKALLRTVSTPDFAGNLFILDESGYSDFPSP